MTTQLKTDVAQLLNHDIVASADNVKSMLAHICNPKFFVRAQVEIDKFQVEMIPECEASELNNQLYCELSHFECPVELYYKAYTLIRANTVKVLSRTPAARMLRNLVNSKHTELDILDILLYASVFGPAKSLELKEAFEEEVATLSSPAEIEDKIVVRMGKDTSEFIESSGWSYQMHGFAPDKLGQKRPAVYEEPTPSPEAKRSRTDEDALSEFQIKMRKSKTASTAFLDSINSLDTTAFDKLIRMGVFKSQWGYNGYSKVMGTNLLAKGSQQEDVRKTLSRIFVLVNYCDTFDEFVQKLTSCIFSENVVGQRIGQLLGHGGGLFNLFCNYIGPKGELANDKAKLFKKPQAGVTVEDQVQTMFCKAPQVATVETVGVGGLFD